MKISFLHALTLWAVIAVINPSQAARVLYLPFPQYSHVQSLCWVTEELRKYGHELWVAYPGVLGSQGVLRNSSLNLIKMEALGDYDADKKINGYLMDAYLYPDKPAIPNPKSPTDYLHLLIDKVTKYMDRRAPPVSFFTTLRELNHIILTDDAFFENIKAKNFDLAIVDGIVGLAYTIIPYRLNVPFCYISIIQDSWRSGTPVLPSFIPFTGLGETPEMTFTQRFANTLIHVFASNFRPHVSETDVSRYAPEKPYVPFSRLIEQAQLWFIEQDIVADYPRPLMPNSKLVGGLSTRNAQPLTGKFHDFYKKSQHGVVVVSFGGSLSELPPHLSNKLLKAFSMTKYDFVWRSNVKTNSSKFLISKWFPQNDLLGHAKTKLFISHCGSNGQYEAIFNGVPLIGVPIFSDQPYNVKRLVSKGWGLGLDLHYTTESDFASAINRVIENKSYKENIQKSSRIFRDRPLNPRQEVAYWIDHVIKYGDSHIRSPGLDLPWYQFLCMDVLLLFGVGPA
ncbi:UDP-glucuronosyltransferase 2C1-like [Haliotis asinina]|uniref:UDP-glucuronosyltransferase 2C1-like n=1 Tax=Haliotis asinina TaxID=109174 RepID=UPI003531D2EF